MIKFIEKIFSIKNENWHKTITLFGLEFSFFSNKLANNLLIKSLNKCEIEIKQLKQEIEDLKKADSRSDYIHNKRFEQWLRTYRWLEFHNKVINKLIDFNNDEELKKAQIEYTSGHIHKNGYDMNIDNPKTLNEKVQWMSLNYYNNSEEIHRIVDKHSFKKYIAEKLGDGYTIPLLACWDNVDDINFEELPQQFVLKSNWGGDGRQVKIIQDKNNIDIEELKHQMKKWLSFDGNPYFYAFNGPSKGLKPCIIAEEYMPIRENEALEYKMFCFNGKLGFCLVEVDYFGGNPHRAYYDKDFNELDYKIGGIPVKHLDHKPETYDKMVEIAEFLAKDFPFVRVDFYDVAGRIYVGEMTFTSGGGFSNFEPVEIDYKLGEMLDITELQKVHNE